jgi:FkbM family methyltransferase
MSNIMRQLFEFRYGSYNILCPKDYHQFLKEVFILDVYRTDLLIEGDIVLDLGATTGDFSIIASKKIGKNGKVIALEPNIEDYKILKHNAERNNCQNLIALNLGIGGCPGEKETTFWGRTFKFKIDKLENILDSISMPHKIDFIKMDIEGIETEVANKSIDIISKARVISLELHGTKQEMDRILLDHGFLFKPITMNYIYRKMITNFLSHPIAFTKATIDLAKDSRYKMHKLITGYDITRDALLTGSYIKRI